MIAGLILTGASLGLFPGLTGPLVIHSSRPKMFNLLSQTIWTHYCWYLKNCMWQLNEIRYAYTSHWGLSISKTKKISILYNKGSKAKKTVFLRLWPITIKIFAPVPSKLVSKCSLSALMNIWNVGWIQPIDEQKLVIVDIKKQDHWQQRNPATSHVILD